MRLSTVSLLASALSLAEASLSPDAQAVCSTLHSKYPKNVVWDPIGPMGIQTVLHSKTYNTALFDYWNAKSAENRPACGFFPSSAEQVQYAVQTLNAHPAVNFALKGGGHNPNLGFSSVKGGVLIAFRPNSQFAIPSPDGESVEVGAGCKWEDVYSALEPLGKTAVGGRLGDVGVMGFMLGGGLSYLSAQYGFACDNVLSFECVLANGTIVNASPKSHPDLYFALSGGGNQYAIVTKMTLKTHDIGVNGKVWGGVRIYGADKHSAVISAVTKFIGSGDDPKAAIIPTFEFIGAVGIPIPAIFVFFFYDGLEPGKAFADFDAIHHISDDTRARSYPDLTNEVFGGDMKGFRYNIRENTFPNMPVDNMTAFLNDHFYVAKKATTAGNLQDLLDLRLFSFALQPMPRNIVEASKKARGGSTNALSMVPESGDRIWIEYDLSWGSPLCDKQCPVFFEKLVNSLHDLHEEKYAGIYPTKYEAGDLREISYNPIFMNDAMYDQDVLQSYGAETYARLRSIHEAYDPEGFLSGRQGGWKFTE